jgi:3-phenylpropionate/cinnamic acid dioxygenase small subunit
VQAESCSDHHDIAEVLVRYATGIDRRDWALFRTCFTDDVRADYETIGTWSGVDEITTFMTETHAAMGHTMHRLSNFAIEVTGDTASARTYVDAIIMSADGQGGVNALGFYDDNLVRTNGGWRIAQRHFTTVHTCAVNRGLEIS